MTNTKKNFVITLFIALNAFCCFWIFTQAQGWSDFPVQWRVCAYTLRGIDIYLLRGAANFIPEIGPINPGFHASPFGLILENIFYGGFLPFETAEIYFIIVNIIVIFVASFILYAKTKNYSYLFALTAILSADFFVSAHGGNAGGMICAFLLISWLLCDNHPYISGIFIAFAMVKPQDALIICLAFIILKRFKPVIFAAVIDVAAWGVSALLLKKGMLELLREFLLMPESMTSRAPFAGIFTLLINNFLPAMLASMIAGIIFVCVLIYFMPDDMPEIFKIFPAFMAVTFWAYSFSNDCLVLILPACICIWLMIEKNSIIWLLFGMYCSYGIIFRSIVARIFMIVNPGLPYNTAHVIARTIFELGIIIIGIIICSERKLTQTK